MPMSARILAIPPLVLLCSLLLSTPSVRADQSTDDLAMNCLGMQRTDFTAIPEAPTQLTGAGVVAAAGKLPTYCLLQGYVAPNVGLELRLPLAGWNGKFFYAGCSASCGSIALSSWARECDYPLRKGYACIVSDMGHQSSQGDGLWAFHNLQAKVDFGFRATHVTAVAGKYVTQAFYGRPASHAYFMGCSTGGRQGLVEAQRFPWDFDGIIAGAPVITEAGTAMDFLWNLTNSVDADGKPMLSRADLELVHQAVLASSDLDDGLKDGVIADPRDSSFNPAQLVCQSGQHQGCLTAAQAQAVKRIYAGPTNSRGEKLYNGGGVQPGSELNWVLFAPLNGSPAPFEKSGADTTRYMLSDLGPSWDFHQFDFDTDSRRLGLMDALYSAASVDLRQFKAAGGKLLIYQGWADPAVAPLNSVDYYETVEKTMGGRTRTQDFFRLFTIPGMNHCFGGAGAYAIDYVSYLEEWIEKSKPPDMLIAAHLKETPAVPPFIHSFPVADEEIGFTRPVFPYPAKTRYRGRGNPASWTSFVAVDSTRRSRTP